MSNILPAGTPAPDFTLHAKENSCGSRFEISRCEKSIPLPRPLPKPLSLPQHTTSSGRCTTSSSKTRIL
jgi:hypothetical protein